MFNIVDYKGCRRLTVSTVLDGFVYNFCINSENKQNILDYNN